PDEPIRAAFQESQDRIQAMARIHEHLYRSPDLAQVDMAEYTRGVASYLVRSYGARAITIRTDVSDVELDIDRAIPCGLIINELVSNALKHAFPPGWQGPENEPHKVCIDLRLDDGQCILTVSDNGAGLPADLQLENVKRESLGLKLVNLLSRQLKGNLKVDRVGGAAFYLTFAVPKKRSNDDK
ncbi:MAG: sensor histidine kinase, partial [Deltaproteobacteria bacterium]|nr:sensor histidine kinase [Deltaproteobacteria bacterium]